MNTETKEFTVDEVPVKLTPIEYKILNLLMKHPDVFFQLKKSMKEFGMRRPSIRIRLWFISVTFEKRLKLIRKNQNI